jgi:hypothetical protein
MPHGACSVRHSRGRRRFACNPQCRISVGAVQQHTEAQFRTDAPKFNEEFTIKAHLAARPTCDSVRQRSTACDRM